MTTTLDIAQLSTAEKIEIIGELWDSIPDTSSELDLPDHHARILDERIDSHRANPKTGDSWEVVKKRLRAK